MIWTDLNQLISENHTFCISAHVSHDADNVGSQLALYWYLKSLGKSVTIYNTDLLPKKFRFFVNSDKIESVKPSEKFDVIAVLDSSNMGRTSWDDIENCADSFINIDHHRDNSLFGTVNAVDIAAAATCQIIYRFFAENN
jgi:phosphoesterase RecJ-like protein